MKTLLLLAGRSRRFWPLEEKMLFPIIGKTLLEHQVERLRAGGIKDIILVGGKHNIQEAKKLFPTLACIEQKDLDLGMQGALLSALPSCKKESVMIVGGNDIIEPAAYRSLQKAAQGKCVGGAILARKVDRYFPGGYLSVSSGRITSIVEKPKEGREPSDLVNIVAHIHSDASVLFNALKKAKNANDDGYEQALDMLFENHIYKAVAYVGVWQPVKFAWHMLPLLELLLKNAKRTIHKTASVHKSAVVDGNVILGEGVKILPHATVVGPCFIGAHTIVGTGALVRGASIGEHCVVGFNTEVKSSVLADHVWTHMTYLGDSVVGRDVSFGGGTITGNLRLDEGEIHSAWKEGHLPTGLSKFGAIIGDHTRFGIHTGINPGIKIGAGSFITGGSFLVEDIPDGSFVRLKRGELSISPNRHQAPSVEKRNFTKHLKKS